MSNMEHIVEVPQGSPDGSIWKPAIGTATTRLREYFITGRVLPTAQDADRIIAEGCQVLSKCAPAAKTLAASTGLVCGYVQSGKTASMTAVSALAKDNGYRVMILIAGTTTNLVTQNRDRLETHLRETAPEWTWVMITNPGLRRNRQEIEALAREWRSEHYDDSDRRTLFVTVMKNHRHLHNLPEVFHNGDLSGVPAIIFV